MVDSLRFSRWAGVFVALAGAALLFAWPTYAAFWSSLFPSLPPTKANSAFGFTLVGLALFLGANERTPRAVLALTWLLGFLVVALGFATLAEHLFAINLGIDHALYADDGMRRGVDFGRMAPNTALAFIFAGLSVMCLDRRTLRAWPSQLFAIVVLLICLEVLVAELYGLHSLYGIATHRGMAISSALLFFLFGVGALLARPTSGLVEPIMKQSPTGALARRLVLVAIAIPLAAGALQNLGLRAKLYSGEFGVAMLVVVIMLLLIGFIWFHARRLDRAEAQAREARAEQTRLARRERAASIRAQLSDRRLRDIVRGLELVVWEADAKSLHVRFVSDQVIHVFGHAIERWRSDPEMWLSIIHPDDRDKVLSTCRSAATAEREHEIEYRAIAAGRRIVWIRHRLSMVRDQAGEPILLRGLMTDITTAKQHERIQSCQHSVTRVLAEATTLRQAAARIIQAVCESLDWQVGALWRVDAKSQQLLCVDLWHLPSAICPEFAAISRRRSFPKGVGLPGRVWQHGEPVWIPDVAADENFPRAVVAAREGLHGAFGLPIQHGAEMLGMMEFFSSEIREPDDEALEMMSAIGTQVGQFIERERAEDAVRTSEERLRFALEAARSWTWDVHLESGDVTWSENAPRLLGLAPQTSPAEILTTLQGVHPQDRPRVAAAYADAVREGHLYDVEYRIVRGDGTECWAAVRGRALRDENGTAMRMLGVATDITERKRIEMRLQEETETVEMVNRIGQMLSAELDLQKLVQAVTDTATQLAGARVGAFFYDAAGNGAQAFTPYALAGASREEFASRVAPRALSLIGSTFRGEGVIRVGDARTQPRDAPALSDGGSSSANLVVASVLGVPVVSRSAKVLGALFFAHPEPDVFGEREERIVVGLAAQAAVAMDNARLYEAERSARAEAETANRVKDEFLAMLGHELRNPIGAISNSTRVLARGGVPAADAEALHAIVSRQTQILSRLVDDLLDVSRLTSGKIVLRRELVNLGEIAERSVDAFRAADRLNQHAMTLEAQAIWVDGDATRLEQVLGNLVENAIKYTPAGGRIAVRVRPDGERAVVEVSDTGRGIEPAMIGTIFDVFTQGPQSLDRAQGGLGIGLTLVKRLVELHGGEVTADSAGPGRGSKFTVRIPRRAALEAPRREPEAPSTGARRILIIEDYADAREALHALLKKDGHVVELAANGREGVEKAVALRPDVAIVDIGLPGLDGYEVARRIRHAEGGKDIYLVALTGYGQQEDRRRTQEADFDAHLVKPLDPAELGRILARSRSSTGAARPAAIAEGVTTPRRSAASTP